MKTIKTPKFWYRKNKIGPLQEYLLMPLSWLYIMGQTTHRFIRSLRGQYRAAVPVICIGNLTAGGSGKTPTALAIMDMMQNSYVFKRPHFLTRGYGGDEEALLHDKAPTIIHSKRDRGAQKAELKGADLIIMDDGLQNYMLYQDLKLMVIDGAMGLGNGKTLPAGPLRESRNHGLRRVDGFVLIGEDTRNIQMRLPKDKPVFSARLISSSKPDKNTSYFAFAGLGYPQKFFDYLRSDLQLDVQDTKTFPDHYAYQRAEIEALIEEAQTKGLRLITTEKDAVRLPQDLKEQIHILPVELRFDEPDLLLTFIKDTIGSARFGGFR